jgi:hypothetical protein
MYNSWLAAVNEPLQTPPAGWPEAAARGPARTMRPGRVTVRVLRWISLTGLVATWTEHVAHCRPMSRQLPRMINDRDRSLAGSAARLFGPQA